MRVHCTSCSYTIQPLQVQGLGTALKILFSDRKQLHLTRMELVALFNVLERYVLKKTDILISSQFCFPCSCVQVFEQYSLF